MPTYTIDAYLQSTADSYSLANQDGGLMWRMNSNYTWVGFSPVADQPSNYINYYSVIKFLANIPRGATITSATIRLMANDSITIRGGDIKGQIYGVAEASPSNMDRPDLLPRTSSATTFINVGNKTGYHTFSVKDQLQEMVNAAYWTDTSPISIVCIPPPRENYVRADTYMESKGYWEGWTNEDFPRLQVTYEYTPTLKTLSLSSNSVNSSRGVGFTIGSILDTTEGSTKTVTMNTSGGKINYNSTTNTVYVSGNLAGEEGKTYTLEITETLNGAIGSPKSTQLSVSVFAAQIGTPPSFVSYTPPPTESSTLITVPANEKDDLMVAHVFVLNTSSLPATTTMAGWTKMCPPATGLFFDMYGASYEIFYRTSNGSEPSSYSISTDGFYTMGGMFVVRDHSARSIVGKSSSGSHVVWDTPEAPQNSLVVLIGGNAMGSDPNSWNNVIPDGTSQPPISVKTGDGVVYFTHNQSGPIPEKSAPLSGGQGDYFAFTLVVEPDGPPTLGALTINPDTVPKGAPTNTVVGEIVGSKPNSTLETVDSSLFRVVGTNLVTNETPTTTGSFPVTIRETLAGAVNSPRETTVSVTVYESPPITFMGASTGTNTAIVPPHQIGDLIYVFAYRDGNNVAPTMATGVNWTEVDTFGASTNSFRSAYKIAASSNEQVGTFTNATSVIVAVYRPGFGYLLSIGTSVRRTGATLNMTYPAIVTQKRDGTSWVITAVGHRSVNTIIETPFSGMVMRANVVDTVDEAALFDTNGGVTDFPENSRSSGGTASGWAINTVEIIVDPDPEIFPPVVSRKSPKSSTWG